MLFGSVLHVKQSSITDLDSGPSYSSAHKASGKLFRLRFILAQFRGEPRLAQSYLGCSLDFFCDLLVLSGSLELFFPILWPKIQSFSFSALLDIFLTFS